MNHTQAKGVCAKKSREFADEYLYYSQLSQGAAAVERPRTAVRARAANWLDFDCTAHVFVSRDVPTDGQQYVGEAFLKLDFHGKEVMPAVHNATPEGYLCGHEFPHRRIQVLPQSTPVTSSRCKAVLDSFPSPHPPRRPPNYPALLERNMDVRHRRHAHINRSAYNLF